MIDVGTVKSRYPTLIDWDDDDAQRLLRTTIQDAECDLSESEWGTLYPRGVAALVAHRTVLKQRSADGDDAGAFPLTQAAADGMSQQMATPTDLRPETAHYYTTTYGAEFRELARRVSGGPRLVA